MDTTPNSLHFSIAITGTLLVAALLFAWSKLFYYRIHKAQATIPPAPFLVDSDAYFRGRSVEVHRDELLPVKGCLHTDKVLSNHEWKYHVFLSFRGEDTRFKFTDHFYGALCRAGINTFRDQEELRTGDEIRPALLTAIEASRISIIVLSKNYASSTWCLDELVKILECRNLKKQVVLPVFYELDPSEVRHQTGSFEDSMARHEKRYKDNIKKVEKWRSALRKVANLSGECYTKESEAEFINKLIQKISIILDRPLLHLPEHAVGLESRKLSVVSLLSIGPNDVDVSMVGIYGTGGVGKTTIAKAVYNSVAPQFESTSFCADVRQNTTRHGLAHVQRSILVDMLGNNDINMHNPHRGIAVMKERLQNKRVLLILDNVDKLKQLQSLAGGCDWFGPGSKVIITTRDKQLLIRHGIEKIYEVEELNKEEALKLLCWNAFRSSEPTSGFEHVSTLVLSYAWGIPLALEIIGSHLFGKDVEEWESSMDAYKKNMNNDIFDTLKVSYESLEYNEKEIFLDVACFFVGTSIKYVEEILGGCGFSSKSGLSILEDRCLVKRHNGDVWMHDLTQSMGREIIRRESEREPWKRSRIWFHEDAQQVLTSDMGTSKIQGIMLEFPQQKTVVWSGNAFEKMVNLRILIIRNAIFREAPNELPNRLKVFEWENYPSSSLPSNFHGNELLKLKLKNATQILQLQEPFKNITHLNIEDCDGLKEVPDVSASPNISKLWLKGCQNLIKIHDSVGSLEYLKELVLLRCSELKEFSAWNQFKTLLFLAIVDCRKLGVTPFDGTQTTLKIYGFRDGSNNFQSDRGSSVIQEVMDRHCSGEYNISHAQIPRCFRYRSNKNFFSFWIQKTLPDINISFAVRYCEDYDQKLNFKLNIGPLKIFYRMYMFGSAATQIFLLTRSLAYKDYLKIQEMLTRLDCWVRVDISLVTSPDNPPASTDSNQDPDAVMMECGVYVSPTCDENFSFIDPNSWYSIKNKSFAGWLAENGVIPPAIVKQKDDISSNLLCKKIMSLTVSPQVKHFAWTAISDQLTSKQSLEEKGSCYGCHICGKRNVKLDFHFLKNCQWARGVWLLSPLGLRVDRMQVNNLPEWMQKMELILDTSSLELFLVIAWGLWSEWNKLCMGLKIEDPPSFLRRMCVLLKDYRIAHRPVGQYMLTDAEVVPYWPLSQATSRKVGDQPSQNENEKLERSTEKGKQVM